MKVIKKGFRQECGWCRAILEVQMEDCRMSKPEEDPRYGFTWLKYDCGNCGHECGIGIIEEPMAWREALEGRSGLPGRI